MIIIPLLIAAYCIYLYMKSEDEKNQKIRQMTGAAPINSSANILVFKHPQNGFVETIENPGLYTFLFGPLYFALKRVWVHALISAAAALMTTGFSWLIYPFFAKQVIINNYLRNGWVQVDGQSDVAQPSAAVQHAEVRTPSHHASASPAIPALPQKSGSALQVFLVFLVIVLIGPALVRKMLPAPTPVAATALVPTAKVEKIIRQKRIAAYNAPDKNFSSVLGNLTKTKNTSASNANFGPRLTMSEEDALKAQITKCWNVPFGAKDAKNMAVTISMTINADRTLHEARIVNQARYSSDSFFRAAADSALRAVRSPLCSPFNLPPDRHDVWGTTSITLNPQDMF